MGVPKREEYDQVTDSRSWFEAVEFFPKMDIDCEMAYGSRSAKGCSDSLTGTPFTDVENYPNICITIASAKEKPDFEEEIYANSLKIYLIIDTKPEDYFFTFDPVIVHAVVHNRMQLVNPFVEGYVMEGGKQYNGDVSLNEIIRIKPPYSTNCYDYVSSWRAKNGTGPLTQSECIEHCKLTTVRSLDKCVGANVFYSHTEELCEYEITATDEIIKNCTKKCQPACYERKYEVEYREKHGSKEEFDSGLCTMIDRMNELENSSYAYGSVENCRLKQIKVTFSFERFRLRRQIYNQQYQSVELFSYIGGYLGLWLGLGFISLFESLANIVCHLWRRGRFKYSSVQNL
ncbi:degenerin unc-8-like [Parasteatoda tepidariorum]|uniref:degenerin unc-8-like n=1 Tax=Parasteatoda tepidariorum TaxID=114398 RepID=UPI001C725C05|nr:uncharacterized protein LOC122270486 [Parasteatoda tepidariorum]